MVCSRGPDMDRDAEPAIHGRLIGLPLFFAEDCLDVFRGRTTLPIWMNLSNALLAFREEVERGRIDGSNGSSRVQKTARSACST